MGEKQLIVEIFTYNSEADILDCIKSAYFLSKDVVVIDQESTDHTREVAEKGGATVYTFPHSTYVEPARDYGIKKTSSEWVMILDADERLTKELAEEIKDTIKSTQYTHYKISRKNIFAHSKWLKYGGWWPDYQIRLIRTSAYKTWPKTIHSTPIIDGTMSHLKNPFLHYFHGDIEQMVKKTIIFENLEADLLFKASKKASTFTFFRKFFGELYRRFFKKHGFLDGTIGIIESIYQAYSKTITYLFLYEKKKSRSL